MRKLALAIGAVAASRGLRLGALTAGAVTSKPLVAVQVDEFSVFPGTQGAPKGKVRFVVTNIGTVEHEFVVLRTSEARRQPAQGQRGGRDRRRRRDRRRAAGPGADAEPQPRNRGTTPSSATCRGTTRPVSSRTSTFGRSLEVPPKGGGAEAGRIDDNLGNPILPSSSPSEWPSQRPLFFLRGGKRCFPPRAPLPLRRALTSRAWPPGRMQVALRRPIDACTTDRQAQSRGNPPVRPVDFLRRAHHTQTCPT